MVKKQKNVALCIIARIISRSFHLLKWNNENSQKYPWQGFFQALFYIYFPVKLLDLIEFLKLILQKKPRMFPLSENKFAYYVKMYLIMQVISVGYILSDFSSSSTIFLQCWPLKTKHFPFTKLGKSETQS